MSKRCAYLERHISHRYSVFIVARPLQHRDLNGGNTMNPGVLQVANQMGR